VGGWVGCIFGMLAPLERRNLFIWLRPAPLVAPLAAHAAISAPESIRSPGQRSPPSRLFHTISSAFSEKNLSDFLDILFPFHFVFGFFLLRGEQDRFSHSSSLPLPPTFSSPSFIPHWCNSSKKNQIKSGEKREEKCVALRPASHFLPPHPPPRVPPDEKSGSS